MFDVPFSIAIENRACILSFSNDISYWIVKFAISASIFQNFILSKLWEYCHCWILSTRALSAAHQCPSKLRNGRAFFFVWWCQRPFFAPFPRSLSFDRFWALFCLPKFSLSTMKRWWALKRIEPSCVSGWEMLDGNFLPTYLWKAWDDLKKLFHQTHLSNMNTLAIFAWTIAQ